MISGKVNVQNGFSPVSVSSLKPVGGTPSMPFTLVPSKSSQKTKVFLFEPVISCMTIWRDSVGSHPQTSLKTVVLMLWMQSPRVAANMPERSHVPVASGYMYADIVGVALVVVRVLLLEVRDFVVVVVGVVVGSGG